MLEVRYVKSLYKQIQENRLTSPEFKILTALFINTQKGYYQLDKRTHSNATFIKLHQEWNPVCKIFKLLKRILFSHQNFKNISILLDNF